ncbi:response regulator, partial [Rhizobiaceae sp. 2RAB30]
HRLTFTSRIDRGTVFSLELPQGTASTAETPATTEPERPRGYGLFGTKVLLVEDDDAVLEATHALLQRWQCEVRTATSTDTALDTLGDTAWVPDIIIADQHLDHGDFGTETVNEARAYLQRAVPALIVTADASEELQLATRGLGIELMRKPVKPAQLRALLAHLLA